MELEKLQTLVVEALDDMKAIDIQVIDVRHITPITDAMIICSGNSQRHIKALMQTVVEKVKEHGVRPLGIEGDDAEPEWILIDLNDVIVHIMHPKARDFYHLEKLWADTPSADQNSA